VTAATEVSVRLPGVLREYAAGQAVVALAAPPGATVADVLDTLARQHPALARRIRDERGAIRQHVHLFVDGEDVRGTDLASMPVRPGAEIFVIPAVSGG
jgi:molybdopterin synthase sulfur carrier subunit